MKVSELLGDKLDFWAGKSDKKNIGVSANGRCVLVDRYGDSYSYSPSTDWSQGGAIIEREKIKLEPIHKLKGGEFLEWNAKALPWQYAMEGPTALIAAMRAFVASRFGVEVDDS